MDSSILGENEFIFSLIGEVSDFYTSWQTVQTQIRGLLQKPYDLGTRCLQWTSGIVSRTEKVKFIAHILNT